MPRVTQLLWGLFSKCRWLSSVLTQAMTVLEIYMQSIQWICSDCYSNMHTTNKHFFLIWNLCSIFNFFLKEFYLKTTSSLEVQCKRLKSVTSATSNLSIYTPTAPHKPTWKKYLVKNTFTTTKVSIVCTPHPQKGFCLHPHISVQTTNYKIGI